jgi:hypothetical protein
MLTYIKLTAISISIYPKILRDRSRHKVPDLSTINNSLIVH